MCCCGPRCVKRAETAHHPVGLKARWAMKEKSREARAHDHLAIPMCNQCHVDFHVATGVFKNWTKAERHAWQAEMSEHYMPKSVDPEVF